MQKTIAAARAAGQNLSAWIISGDLAENPEPEVYQHLKNIFDGLGLPVFCVPGNHDNPDIMLENLPEYCAWGKSVSIGSWGVRPQLDVLATQPK